LKITINTNPSFDKGQSNYAVESLLCHVAHQLGAGKMREIKSSSQSFRNNNGEIAGFVVIEVGERVPGKAKCDNCGTVYDDDELDSIGDLFERVAPGDIMPAGECPDEHCGALCYAFWAGE
jgi:hypothetical protein